MIVGVWLILNPSLCVPHFKRPKLRMPEFGARTDLLIKKVSTEKMGHLIVPQIYLAH